MFLGFVYHPEVALMPVYTTTTYCDEATIPPQYLAGGDSSIVIVRSENANAVEVLRAASSPPGHTVSATILHATAHYGDLLRKLAD